MAISTKDITAKRPFDVTSFYTLILLLCSFIFLTLSQIHFFGCKVEIKDSIDEIFRLMCAFLYTKQKYFFY